MRLRVLLYHRIDAALPDEIDINPDLTTATPTHFEAQLRHVIHAYHPVGAAEVLAAISGDHRLPERAILITFDDGFRDFQDTAWPLLKQYRVPVVLFVPTAFLDAPTRVFWTDALWQMVRRADVSTVRIPEVGALPLGTALERLNAFRTLVVWLKSATPGHRRGAMEQLFNTFKVRPDTPRVTLTWAEIRRLARDGVTIAAHSQSHERLDQLEAESLWSEVDGSRADLVRELNSCPPLFAYPYGNVNPSVVHALRRAEFSLGFTTVCGVSDLRRDHRLLIRRDDAHASMARFILRLSEPFSTVRTLRHALPDEMRVAC